MEYVTEKRRTPVEEKRRKGSLPDVGEGGEWRRRCETAGEEDRRRWRWGSGWRRCGCGRGFPITNSSL
ncbi:hypothetical protein Hanom_Chr16g01432601 [Helianthus anomalus]